MAVRIRNDALDSKGADRWFVTDGMNAVGPVRLDLLARGVATGKVPLDSFLRHETWKVWRPLTDFTEFVEDAAANLEAASDLSSLMADEVSGDRLTMELLDADFASFSGSDELPGSPSRPLISANLSSQSGVRAEPGRNPDAGATLEIPVAALIDAPIGDTAAKTATRPIPVNPVVAQNAASSEAVTSEAVTSAAVTSEAVTSEAVSSEESKPGARVLEPKTELSQDLLGAARADLDSILDDEETKVPEARVRSSIPQAADAGSSDAGSSGAIAPGAVPSVPAPPRPGGSLVSGPISSRPLSPSQPPSQPPPRMRSVPPPVPPPRVRTSSEFPREIPRPASPPSSVDVPRTAAIPKTTLSGPPVAGASAPRAGFTDDIHGSREPWGLARPAESAEMLAEDGLAGATGLSDGLLLLLGAAVRRGHAELALLHRVADEGATVVCAHGPAMVDALGHRTRLLDPAVVAAAGGHLVVAEPVPGPAGEATASRLRMLGDDPEGVAMFPIRPHNRLLAILEVGKSERFTARELARIEDLVDAFSAQASSQGWIA